MRHRVGLRFYASRQLATGRRGGGDHLTDLYVIVYLRDKFQMHFSGCTDGFAKIAKLNSTHVVNCNDRTGLVSTSLESCKKTATEVGGNAFNWDTRKNDCWFKECLNQELIFKEGHPDYGPWVDIYSNIYAC